MTIKSCCSGLLAVGAFAVITFNVPVARAQSSNPGTRAPGAPDVQLGAKTEIGPGPTDFILEFGLDSNQVDINAQGAMDELAVWLKEDPKRVVYVEAHPEEASQPSFNSQLGGERADAARRYLVAHGAGETQIKVIPYGQRRDAVAPNLRDERTIFVVSAGLAVNADAGVEGAVAPAPTMAPAPAPAAPPAPAMLPPVTPERRTLVYTEERETTTGHLLTPFGMAISVGGGVVGFVDQDARDITDTGGEWEARLTLGTRSPIAIEAAYVGSAQGIDALGVDSNAMLVGSAIEGDARLNLTTSAVQPYIFGGIGFTHYEVANTNRNTSSINDEEDMGHVPVGAGLGFQTAGLLIDVRGTFRAAFDDDLLDQPVDGDEPDLIPDQGDAKAELDTWNVGARVGWEF
ncbi:MAG TPA: OmpA family protein [Kofleriaceae bacterium]|nr:OmpA family protein [Kofleriaceae bacterium]